MLTGASPIQIEGVPDGYSGVASAFECERLLYVIISPVIVEVLSTNPVIEIGFLRPAHTAVITLPRRPRPQRPQPSRSVNKTLHRHAEILA